MSLLTAYSLSVGLKNSFKLSAIASPDTTLSRWDCGIDIISYDFSNWVMLIFLQTQNDWSSDEIRNSLKRNRRKCGCQRTGEEMLMASPFARGKTFRLQLVGSKYW